MGKRVLRFALLGLLMVFTAHMNAQTLLEGFESGIPSSWKQAPATGVTAWTVGTSGLSGVSAYEGNNYVSLYTEQTQTPTKLILPMVFIGGMSRPELSFYLVKQARSAAQGYARDTLRVWYRTATGGAWQPLQTFSEDVSGWTRKAVSLEGRTTDSIQLSMEFVFGGGRGIGLDHLRVGTALVCTTPTNLRAFAVSSTGASLTWAAHAQTQWANLKVSSTHLANPATDSADIFNGIAMGGVHALTGLTPATTYYFYVQADCGDGDISAWSAEGSFTTGCAPFALPYTESFDPATQFNTCWTGTFSYTGWTTMPSASTYAPSIKAIKDGRLSVVKLYGYYYQSNSGSTPILQTTTAWVATPELNAGGNITSKQATFLVYASDKNYKLHVGLTYDGNDEAAFTELAEVKVNQASTWEEITVPFTGYTGTGTRLAFRVSGADNNADVTMYIDSVVVEDIPLCPKASVLKAMNISGTTADLTWLGTAPSWNIKISTMPLSDPETASGAGVLSFTTSSVPYHVTGLSEITHYYWYVQANCTSAGNGTSAWSVAQEFTTTQTPVTLPYTCNFEDAEASRWLLVNGTLGKNKWVVGAATNHGIGSHALYVSKDSGATNAYNTDSKSYIYAVRALHLDTGAYKVAFDWKCYGEDKYDVLNAFLVPIDVALAGDDNNGMAWTNNTPPSGWIGLAGADGKFSGSSTWQRHAIEVNITNGGNYNLVFFWKNDYSGGTQPPAAVDNISVRALTCLTPDSIAVTNITQTSATLGWTPSRLNETQWELKVSTVRIDPDLTAGDVYSQTVTSPTVNLSSLTHSTVYYVYLRSNCGATDGYGEWESMVFHTECQAIGSLPYTEDFSAYESGENIMPTCWTAQVGGGPSKCYVTSTYNHTEGASVPSRALDMYRSYSGTDVTAVMPAINVAGKTLHDMQLEFFMRTPNATTQLYVGVMTDPADLSTLTIVDTLGVSMESTWEFKEVHFTRYTGNAQYIVFRLVGANVVYLDDIRVSELPTCLSPMPGITATNITQTSARIAWTPRGSATAWDVAYGPVGFDPDAAMVTPTTVNDSAVYTISGLTASTTYDVYVRSNCGGTAGVSTWKKGVVTTLQIPDTLPYSCDFENASDPQHWRFENGAEANKWLIGSDVSNGTGTHALYVSNNDSTNVYDGDASSSVYVMHLLQLPVGKLHVSFDWKVNGEISTVYNEYYDYMRVYLAPATAAIEAGTSVETTPAGWIALGDVYAQQLTWNTFSDTIDLNNAGQYNLVFYWRNDYASGNQPPAAVDNVLIEAVRGCFPSGTISLDKITGSTATAAWALSTGAPTYHLKVSDAPLTDPATGVGNVLDTVLTVNTYTMTGLQPRTQYYVYVQTVCGSQTFAWSQANFITDSADVSVFPFVEDFEGEMVDGIPQCWTRISTGSYPKVSTGDSHNHTPGGNHAIEFWGFGGSFTALVTPRLNVDSLSKYKVECFIKPYYSSGSGTTLIVGVMEDPTNKNTFVPLDTLTTSSNWERQTISLAAYKGRGKYVAFIHDVGDTDLDDITILEVRECDQPFNVQVTNVVQNDARINWNGGASTNTSYNVKVSTAPINPDSVHTGLVLDETGITNTYLQISDAATLDPNTTYWVYVQSECDAADGRGSYWSYGVSFTTVCLAQNIPFTENFAGIDGKYPSCWQSLTEQGGTGTPVAPTCTQMSPYFDADSTSLRMRVSYSSTGSSVNYTRVTTILPEFVQSIQALQVDFAARSSSTSRTKVYVGVMSDVSDASTFTIIDSVFLTNTWQKYVVGFSHYTGSGKYIGWRLAGDENLGTRTIYLDAIAVDSLVACNAPTRVQALNVTSNTADISWSAAGTAQQFEVIVSTEKYNIAALDSLKATGTTAILLDTVVNGTQWSMTGLNPVTTYYAYVRTVCGSGSTGTNYYYHTPVEFRTACGTMTLPYSDSFEHLGTDDMPECWTRFNSTVEHSTSSSATAGGAVLRFYDSNNNDTVTALAVSPEISATDWSALEVSFQLCATTWQSTDPLRLFEVGVMSDPTDSTSFVPVDTLTFSTTSTFQNYFVSLASYTGTGNHIAFRVSGQAYFIDIDELLVHVRPSCYRPDGITFVSNTTDNIVVDWTPHVATDNAWQLSYGLPGSNPDAGTLVTANTHPFTLTGLQPSTSYDVYVRTNCGSVDGLSEWRGPLRVNTAQVPVALPYVQDFEDGVENAHWVTSNGINGWFIGGAIQKDGNNGLYISNDNGTTRGYDNNKVSYSYAMRLLSIPAEEIHISFDWIGRNENNWDCAHAFLVPAAQVSLLQAGKHNGMNYGAVTTPAGWIDVKKKMSGESTNWQHENVALTVASAGDYYLTFFWKNDGSGGAGDGAVIDNLFVGKDCGVTIKNIVPTASSANMAWSGRYDSVRVKVFTTAQPLAAVNTLTGDVFDSITTDSTLTLTGLQSDTVYYYYLNPVCGGTNGMWINGSFRTLGSCALAMGAVTTDTTSVVLTWGTSADSVHVIVDTENHTIAALDTLSGFLCDTIVATDTFRLYHLTPATTYYYYVRSICPSDSDSWKASTFTTQSLPLRVPYVCDFENAVENAAWTLLNGTETNQWYIGTAVNHGGTHALYISKDNGVSNTYNNSSSTSATYAIRGSLSLTPGMYHISYDWRCKGEKSSYSSSVYDYMRAFLMPVGTVIDVTDHLSRPFSSTGVPDGWFALDSGHAMAGSDTWQTMNTSFMLPAAGDYDIVFCWYNDFSGGADPAAAVDNISFQREACSAWVKAVSATARSLDMHLGSTSDSVRVKVFSTRPDDGIALETLTADVCDTIVDSVLTIGNLNPVTRYYYYVVAICNGTYGTWISDSIETECSVYTLPYSENFGGALKCMRSLLGTQSTIFGGGELQLPTSYYDYYWYVTPSSISANMDDHVRLEITGPDPYVGDAGTHAWFIMPDVAFGANDTAVLLSFDMALTAYTSTFVPGQQSDDRFVIMASVDGGATWTANNVLAEWNNTGSARVFDQIPSTKTRMYVPVKHFAGDTVTLAFYGESIVQNFETGNNVVRIDNVQMLPVSEVNYIDNVCLGHSYQGYGFDLTDTAITTSPTKEFSRYANDTLYTLTLTVLPSSEFVVADTICAGETYTQYGFNITASTSGTHHRYLNAVNGCDSTITLNLTVLSGYSATDNIAICQNQLPYVWHGQSYTGSGTYTYHGGSATGSGCDSVLTLVLTVNPTYNRSDSKTISSSQLPYTYGDTVFAVGTQSGTFVLHRQTVAGCDSIVTLTLTVQTVGLDIAAGGLFDLSPNPVEHGGKVRVHADFTAADLDGLRVEILSSNGARVRDFRPDSYPIWIAMPEESGLYMVRITTGTGKVLYGKVLVK